MKPIINTMALLVITLAGCTHTSQPETAEAIPPLKHVMLPAPATNSDSVVPGIAPVPYLTPEDNTEKRYIAITFDDWSQEPELLHTVHFKTGSHALSAAERSALNSRADIFKNGITLSGYADPRGSDQYNERLSERRVKTVEKHLNRMGIFTERQCAFGKRRLPDIHNCEGYGNE